MNTSHRLQKIRQSATRLLGDPLGVRRFRPDLRLDPEDLPGLDRESRGSASF